MVCSLVECWRSLSALNIPRKCSGSRENSSVLQRRQSKYILEGRSRRRGCGVWGGGVPSPLGKGSGEGAQPPPQKCFWILDLKMAICGAFLVQFFCSSAKTLRGRKDTLVQVYFYWGQLPPRPHPPPETTPPVFSSSTLFGHLSIRSGHSRPVDTRTYQIFHTVV